MLNAIVITPERIYLRQVNGYEGAKELLGDAFIERLPLSKSAVAYFDEQGLLKRLPENEVATIVCRKYRSKLNLLVGTVVIFGESRGCTLRDVPQDVIETTEELRKEEELLQA